MNPLLPFGGVGNSGSSSLHGKIGFDNCSHRKPIMYSDNYNGFPSSIKYPPYNEGKVKTVRRLAKFGNVFLKTSLHNAAKKLLVLGVTAYAACHFYQKFLVGN